MILSSARYAIYYAPSPESEIWAFGSKLLGYDASTGQRVEQLVPPGQDPDRWVAVTSEPRRYGFHATLKAPFYLMPDLTETDLIEGLHEFAQTYRGVDLSGLSVRCIGSFIAMTPVKTLPELNALASETVRIFDRFRAPLTTQERERRLKSPLTDRQIMQLDQWGYPYVFDDFRFHMTLTGPVHNDDRADLCETLRQMAEHSVPLAPVSLDRIAVFKQDDTNGQFKILKHMPLQ